MISIGVCRVDGFYQWFFLLQQTIGSIHKGLYLIRKKRCINCDFADILIVTKLWSHGCIGRNEML